MTAPYGNTTSTLKNLYAEFPPAGTSPHGPSNRSAPFNTARAPGTFHFACGGSNSTTGFPSASLRLGSTH